MGAALLLASEVALSEAITGTNGADILHGSPERDTIAGGNGDDQLYGHKEKETVSTETPAPTGWTAATATTSYLVV